MKKETGILFKPEMIHAILDGNKTMTRRVVTFRNKKYKLSYEANNPHRTDLDAFGVLDENGNLIETEESVPGTLKELNFCRWNIGDLLYVKEAVRLIHVNHSMPNASFFTYQYKKDYAVVDFQKVKSIQTELSIEWAKKNYDIGGTDIAYVPYKSPMFMPKKAARIWLEITDIKVERLQDISDGDVAKEGVTWNEPLDFNRDKRNCKSPAQRAFRLLWDKINGEDSWDSNPYLWAISFKQIQK